jgi:hypothetical protein
MFWFPKEEIMFHELASAFAGFVLLQTVTFIVGDALGLLGKPFGKITLL